ncbi:MAG: fluoride efflux transporter CrcB [Sulfurovum sp.]|nr:fluoride efflux transporter CrcB [Sulfurovum sp.]
MNLNTIIAVASGGALGASLRLLMHTSISKYTAHTTLPLATLFINLLGSLLIGILFAYFHSNTSFPPYVKTFLITGLLGAFTTYSTFAIESFFLLESGHYTEAFATMALNLFGTIFFAGIGYILMMQLYK